MQFSERWLRTLVDPDLDSDGLAHLLTMSGLEVESCVPVAPPFSGVVVARVLSAEKHPNADKLRVCRVDAGTGAELNVVCGAPNVEAGMLAPLALEGARLPGEGGKPMEIRAGKLRGVESQGMLCSAREIGLSHDHSGLLVLEPTAAVGQDIREALALDDRLFTIKLTPNRADCLSVLGVAREVAALTGARLAAPPTDAVPASVDARHAFGISSPQGCGRFTGRVIRGVNANAPTPAWMRERLERAGQRCISALVDVTNYVMLELGRPLHVYDLDKLAGAIDVRFGRAGESLKLLNEQTVALDESVLCITDASGPIGLAGIMGGDGTKADLETRNIFLESAFFRPEVIAGRARRFNFTSDASHRFERGVDFNNNIDGIERATRLILDICGGTPGPVDDVVGALPERQPVRMRAARARKVIGVRVPDEEMMGIFARLGFAPRSHGEADALEFEVSPPSYRFDILIEEDLIEEVARVYGFDRIPALPPVASAAMRSTSERTRTLHDLRALLAASDYQEVVNFSFVDEQWEADFSNAGESVRVLNPIASQMALMRTTLMGGLVANVAYNLNRKLDRIRLFEVGRAFLRDASAADGDLQVAGLRQPARVAAIAYGPAVDEQWGQGSRAVDFFDVKGDLESLVFPLKVGFKAVPHPAFHPGRSARVSIDGRPAGWIGELHPKWQRKYELPHAPVLFELDAERLLEKGLPRYRGVSKFPPVVRDLAFVLDESVMLDAVLGAMDEVRPAHVQSIRLFDLYRGKGMEQGKKSLAFRVVMQDTEKTLTDAEAEAAIARLTEAVASRFGGKLRS